MNCFILSHSFSDVHLQIGSSGRLVDCRVFGDGLDARRPRGRGRRRALRVRAAPLTSLKFGRKVRPGPGLFREAVQRTVPEMTV